MEKDIIQRIKDKIDIHSVISEQVNLKKAGKSYKGPCPFHADKDPSFNVSIEKQSYYCFGCHKSGDVISFVMDSKGLSFNEALKELAARAGIPIDDSSLKKEKPSEKKLLYEANKEALNFFISNLFSGSGDQALFYLKGRGLSEDTIRTFSIGYAPDSWDGLLNHLKKKGVSPEIAFKAGLLRERSAGGGYYDAFRARVIFPIKDTGMEIVGFGGRIIAAGEPKYLNTSETPIFEKRRLLYNLADAKAQIRSNGAVIVEGYMDVVSLYNAGFNRTVATLGTALGEEHIRLLHRFTDSIILVFDGDEAGRKAMNRSIEPFLATDVLADMVILPPGMDPDDIAKQGLNVWNDFLGNAKNMWDFIFDESFKGKNPSNINDQYQIIKETGEKIGMVKNITMKNILLNRLATMLKIDQSIILRNISRKTVPQETVIISNNEDAADKRIIRLMLFSPKTISLFKTLGLAGKLISDEYNDLGNYILKEGNGVLNNMQCPDNLRKIASCLVAEGLLPGDEEKAFIDSSIFILMRSLNTEISKINADKEAAERDKDFDKVRSLTRQWLDKINTRQNLQNAVMEAIQKVKT